MERTDHEVRVVRHRDRASFTDSLWVVLACMTIVAVGHAQPTMKFELGVVKLFGLPSGSTASMSTISDEQWNSILSVYTHEAYLKNIDQPIAGRYFLNGDSLLFKPVYPFSPGQSYHAVFILKYFLITDAAKSDSPSDRLELSFSVPEEIHPLTTVEAIYPESANLPENLLRMYVYFSAPMMPGEAYSHIKLIRENGTMVERAFLVIDQELWDSERKRFTLLFDPGRIKRDLRSNIDLGTPIRQGEKYHLVINSAWRGANGNSLAKSIRKTFFVAQAERAKVTTRTWSVITPLAGTVGDVIVSFDRPMDHAMALKHITVNSHSGIVAGHAETVDDVVWKFTPDHPWTEGEYVLAISPLLEDVAGNNLNNVFDLDVSKERRVNSIEPIKLSFTISAHAR
jgi:hypothetical protein